MKKSLSASMFTFTKPNKHAATTTNTVNNHTNIKETKKSSSRRKERDDDSLPHLVASKKLKIQDSSDEDEIEEPLSLPSSAKDESEDEVLFKMKLRHLHKNSSSQPSTTASSKKAASTQLDAVNKPLGSMFITKLRKSKASTANETIATKDNNLHSTDNKENNKVVHIEPTDSDDTDVLNFTGMEELCKSTKQNSLDGDSSATNKPSKSRENKQAQQKASVIALDSDDDDFEPIPTKNKSPATPVSSTATQKTSRSPMASKFRFNTSSNSTTSTTISISPSSLVTRKKTPKSSGALWIDKHQPQSEDELAMHAKKIVAVKEWLQNSLRDLPKNVKNPPRMLVLTGPCGAGKTALVRVLVKELGCELCEWVNPPHIVTKDANDNLTTPYTPRLLEFRKWLRSQGLFSTQKKVILIEDMPFLADAGKNDEFRSIIRDFLATSWNPLVFILSDTYTGNSAINMILTPDILESPCVHSISVNAVNNTEAKKALVRIASAEGYQISQTDLMQVFESNEGDIRAAINALQFLCIDQVPDEESNSNNKIKSRSSSKKGKDKQTSKKKPTKHIDMGFLGSRDLSLSIFHALGKVLYNKRLPDPDGKCSPDYLNPIYHRLPMKSVPEEVMDRIYVDPSQFNMFLHENYLSFFTDIDDIALATQYLSDSDTFAKDWKEAPSLSTYISSVATRGFMFANTHDFEHKFQPYYKPQVIDIMRKAEANSVAARELMENEVYRLRIEAEKETLHPTTVLSVAPPTILYTELLPFIHRIASNARSNLSHLPPSRNFNNYNTSQFRTYNPNNNNNMYSSNNTQTNTQNNTQNNATQNNNSEYTTFTRNNIYALLNNVCGYSSIQAYMHTLDKHNRLEKWYVDGDAACDARPGDDVCDDNTNTAHDSGGGDVVEDIEEF